MTVFESIRIQSVNKRIHTFPGLFFVLPLSNIFGVCCKIFILSFTDYSKFLRKHAKGNSQRYYTIS